MSSTPKPKKEKVIEAGIEEMHLENGTGDRKMGHLHMDVLKQESDGSTTPSPLIDGCNSASQSPMKQEKSSHSPEGSPPSHEEVIGGDVTLKMDPGQPPKLARSTSQKVVAGPPKLFNDAASKTDEARKTFQTLHECIYSSKWIGSTEHDSMECECAEEWGKIDTLSFCLRSTYIRQG